jgi:hypothetical protein
VEGQRVGDDEQARHRLRMSGVPARGSTGQAVRRKQPSQ